MLTAVVTGVAGQDGSYLAEQLLDKDYFVVGVTKRHSTSGEYENLSRCVGSERFLLLEGDICDPTFIYRALHDHRPHEWYNLAAQSHVGHSFSEPVNTFMVDAVSVVTQLDAIRQVSPYTRFYQASTSELFGATPCPPSGFSESHPFYPRSPYGVAKLAAFWSVKNYRESYGLFAVNGILHNHSSPRRGLDFATRKITMGLAKVKMGLEKTVKMGDLSAFRDEGHSADYCKAMHLMLQQKEPEDFVVATGRGATIEEMFRHVAALADLPFEEVYEKDERFMRPSDVPFLLGNPTKAYTSLGWSAETTWEALLEEMYNNDLDILKGKMQNGIKNKNH